MSERLSDWHPRREEIERIVEEMRPVIRQLVEIERARFLLDALTALTPTGVRTVTLH